MKPMSLIRRNHSLYIRKRVPRRYQHVERRDYVWISLRTDSEVEAKQKAPVVWEEMLAAWEAKLEGAVAEGEDRIAAAKNLAAKRGYRFLHAKEVARLPTHDLLERVEAVKNSKGKIDLLEAEALLGGAEAGDVTVTAALTAFWKVGAPKTAGKSEDQIRRWKNPRIKAVANFIKVVGDKPIDQITTPDLFEFRGWWWDRIEDEGLTPNSANKDFIHLTSMLKVVARAKDIPLHFNTDGLAIDEGKKNTRPPFSTDWIKEKLLAPGALNGLNPEARGIVLGMINTGARPSELAGLLPHHIVLDTPVPYIDIKAEGRKLKTPHSERRIPLSLQLFCRVRKGQEPVLVKAFSAEPAVERLNEGVVGRLARAREVEDHPALIGPEVHIARDELAALVDPNRLGIARCAAHPVERCHDIFAAVAVAHIEHWHVA